MHALCPSGNFTYFGDIQFTPLNMKIYFDVSRREHTYGYGQALGNPSLAELLQAESYDSIALISFIKSYRMYYNITDTPDIQTYYCDNITVINQVKEIKATNISPTTHNLADYDIQITMIALCKDLPGEIQPHHVKGHQDSKQNPNQSLPLRTHKKKQLSWEAKLN
eukprot:11191758-Ditylum_brightwellii.AAC.1